MSTDALLDFLFGRTARSIERRASSADAILCPCLPTIIGITGICGAEDDPYVCKNIGHSSRAIFPVIYRSELFADRVFGRDRSRFGLI
jgi:hypothetical protein